MEIVGIVTSWSKGTGASTLLQILALDPGKLSSLTFNLQLGTCVIALFDCC